jgi:hypothetical protein
MSGLQRFACGVLYISSMFSRRLSASTDVCTRLSSSRPNPSSLVQHIRRGSVSPPRSAFTDSAITAGRFSRPKPDEKPSRRLFRGGEDAPRSERAFAVRRTRVLAKGVRTRSFFPPFLSTKKGRRRRQRTARHRGRCPLQDEVRRSP